jgi:hypothetical protein
MAGTPRTGLFFQFNLGKALSEENLINGFLLIPLTLQNLKILL